MYGVWIMSPENYYVMCVGGEGKGNQYFGEQYRLKKKVTTVSESVCGERERRPDRQTETDKYGCAATDTHTKTNTAIFLGIFLLLLAR